MSQWFPAAQRAALAIRARTRLAPCLLALLLLLLALPAFAVQPDTTGKHFLTHPVVTPELRVLPDAGGTTALTLGANQKPGASSFLQRAGGTWNMRWDARAGRPNLVQGSGVALIPGNGNKLRAADIGLASGQAVNMAKLESLLRDFADHNAELLGIKGMQFQLDEGNSAPYGDGTTHWFVQLDQMYKGVRVQDAYMFFRLSHGNIVQFGTYRVAPVTLDVTPALSRKDAFEAAFAQMPFKDGARIKDIVEAGELLIVPTSANAQALGVRYAGAEGKGYDHRLVWRFVYRLHDDSATYEVWFDAHSNELLQVNDLTVNAEATVTGGVYPISNQDVEVNVPLPFVDVQNGGNKTTDLDGHYDFSGGSASSSLGGKYFDINDNCGALSLSDSSTGNLDFGTSTGTDCATPGFGGAGNTHASRSAFYHLTLINRNAVTYYPSNSWLDSNVSVNVNINDQCNAYWDGSSLNFFKSGGGCANTGELSGVFLHEWGHGFDTNTGGSAPGDYGSGEAVGDTFAFIYNRDACIGTGFFPTGSGCTGVRDVSEYSVHNPNPDFISQPSTVEQLAGGSACPYFTPSGAAYQGPMGYEGHRESLIPSSANWDLAQNLIAEYGVEQGWEEMNRIWYGSLLPSKSAYQIVSGGRCNPAAEIDGCGANNWYTVFLAADDDDGNLANGTPNACRIWDAYEAHGIACGARPACTGGAAPGFTLSASDPEQSMCAPGSVAYTIDVASVLGYTAPVQLAVTGLPAGLTASFSVNPVTPGTNTELSLTGDTSLLAGDYTVSINGTGTGADPQSTDVTLAVSAGAPAAPALSGPGNGASDVSTSPVFSWAAVTGASSYTLEVATDAAFGNIVVNASAITATSYAASGLNPLATYFWRVTAASACGASAPSAAFSFTTANLICSSPGVTIPDGNVTGVSDSIVVSQPGNLTDLNLIIRADHTYVGDLSFELSNGSGTVIVIDQPGTPPGTYGCSNDNVDVTLDDGAAAPVEGACSATPPALGGTLSPNNPINATFVGQPLSGTWTLTARDNAGGDDGSLAEWCMVPSTDFVPVTYSVGGTVSGLNGTGLVLQLNGADDLGIAADGAFTFPGEVADGGSYAVSVLTQPGSPEQTCTVSNGSGSIAGADVTNVAVVCEDVIFDRIFADGFELPPPAEYTVGGSVSGLTGAGLQLQLNGTENLPISADGAFIFNTGLLSGAAYAVAVLSQPTLQNCTLANASGSIGTANVTDVTVTCVDLPPVYEQPILDPGFEATSAGGGTNPNWSFTDNLHATFSPFCDDSCAGAGNTIPKYEGEFTVWFGGWTPPSPMTTTFSQSVTITSGGSRYLNYWQYLVNIPDTASSMTVSVDSTVLATLDIDAATADAGFVFQSIDVSAYADDTAHTVTFQFDNAGGGVNGANLYIDMVTISETNTPLVPFTGIMATPGEPARKH